MNASLAEALAQVDAGEPAGKTDRLLKVAEMYLSIGDSVSAENFCGAAAALAEKSNFRLLICQAQIFEHRFKYIEASETYLKAADLEKVTAEILFKSIISGLLSPMGPARDRIFARISLHAENTNLTDGDSCGGRCFREVLRRVERKLLLEDVTEIEAFLAPHQRVMHANKMSTFRNAIAEYNIHVIGAEGGFVSMEEIGKILTMDTAEEFVCAMITKGKIRGRISHKQGGVVFDKPVRDSGFRIREFCEKVTRLADKVSLI